jgi:predicted dehydrogenase
MTYRLRVAVVGLGIGRGHAQAFQSLPDQFELVALCDTDEAKARELAVLGNVPYVCTDLSELCRLDDVDVIDICTPSSLHFEQACEVLSAGKHVICEKPLAGSLREVDELARAEVRSGRRIMPILQYRFGDGLQKLKFLADEGLTGRAYVTTVETAWRRRSDYYTAPWRGKWKTELGGTLVTHAIHTHDMLTYILGPVKNVFARTATRVHPIEVEDCASISLEMADGSLASLSVTVGSCEQISRHRFCFSNLTAESNTRSYSNSGDPWTFTGDSPELAAQIEAALARFVPQPEGFGGQFSRFYYAIQSGAELPVTVSDARASIELLTAIYASARTLQTVDLPIGPAHPLYAGWTPSY